MLGRPDQHVGKPVAVHVARPGHAPAEPRPVVVHRVSHRQVGEPVAIDVAGAARGPPESRPFITRRIEVTEGVGGAHAVGATVEQVTRARLRGRQAVARRAHHDVGIAVAVHVAG